jgi:acyl-CoA synthetase (AMP-forming)/AMP-acid ligase II
MTGTIGGLFREAAASWAARPFLAILPEVASVYGIDPGEITYAEAAAEVAVIATRYADAGYGPGHRIAVMLDNRPAIFLHWFALNGLGVSVVPLNPDLRPAELDYVLRHSEACLAVATVSHLPRLRDAGVCASVADTDAPPRATMPARDIEPGAESECALLYTSGTTGRPKGCVLSNAYFLRCGRWYTEIGGHCTLHPGTDRLITPLPMVHVNAMAFSTLAMVLTGGCVVPLDRFHPRQWWASVRDSRASILHSLGVMPTMLLGLDPSPDDRAHCVRFGFAPGVDPRYHAAFEARFGIPLIDAWSMTETGAGGVVIASHEPRHIGRSCFGRADASLDYRLVDEAGADVADGMPGELLVRAAGADPRAGFFTEYLKDPEATAQAWEGGWFHTGDVVRRDAEGNMFFVDRRKNVIRRSGENIAAVEVESVLRRHPAVREVACAAAPDDLRGEEVLACIVPRAPLADPRAVAEELVALALAELAYFKAPGWVAFVESLPLTGTNKIQRGELKSLARTLPGTPGCIDVRSLKKRQA